MKKNKFASLVSIAALTILSSAVIGGHSVLAADTDTEKGSKATLEMKAVDPTDPDKPILHLKSVPSVTFMGVKVTGEAQTVSQATTVSDPVSVVNPLTDGWTVTMSATPFKGTTDETKILRAAQLHFLSTTDSITSDVAGNEPTAPSEFKPNEVAANIFGAETGKGNGTWDLKYTNDQVQLDVPSGATADTYNSILTWTLTNAPMSPLK